MHVMRLSVLASVLAVVLPAAGEAQKPEQQSAFTLDPAAYGGFVGMDMRFGDVADDFAVFMGGTLALMLEHRAYLGVRGAGLVTSESAEALTQASNEPAIRMGYGGIVAGYVVPTSSLVQFTIETVLAAGGVRLDVDDGVDDDEDWDAVFLFEPAVGAELKLARIVRLGFGVGYQFVGGVDTPGLEDRDFRGAVGTATLRLGWF